MAQVNDDPGAAGLDTGDAGAAGAAGAAAEPSLRDALDAAFDEASTDDPPPAGGRVRDDSGRFAPAAPATQAPAPAPGSPVAPPDGQPQGVTRPAPRPGPQEPGQEAPPPALKAPAQWKPEAREKWAGIDPSVQLEVTRREREFQTHLQQSAGFRDFVEAFTNVVRPYEMFIRQENSNPLAAVQNLFQTAAELRVGTPINKAMMVAGLVQQYGIDLQMLDTALAQRFGVATNGVNPQALQQMQAQPAPQVLHDPRVDQYIFAAQQQQARALEVETREIESATLRFAEENEFFYDVRDEVADMIEMAARRGIVLPVKDAYEKACALNPEVSKIMSQRQTASSTRATTQAALRAKRAAASIKGEASPHGATVPKDDSIRASLEAAFESSGDSRM